MNERTPRPEQQALAQQDYPRAIELLAARVAKNPDDLETQLELALTYMLAGDEQRFAAMHQRVADRLGNKARRGRVKELWQLSLSYFQRLMQAAAVVAVVTGSGCERAATTVSTPTAVADSDVPRSKYAVPPPAAYSEYAVVRPNPIEPRPVELDAGQTFGLIQPAQRDAGAVVTPQPNPDTPKHKYGIAPRPRYAVRPPSK